MTNDHDELKLRELDPYNDVTETILVNSYQEQLDQGLKFEMTEAEVRGYHAYTTSMILEAKDCMQDLGIKHADFPTMFNELLRMAKWLA